VLIDFISKEIRKEFLNHLDEDEQEEEREIIKALEDYLQDKSTAKDPEAAARPTEAGDYRRPWDGFRAGCRLFKEEIDKMDKQGRDPSDKTSFGTRTKITRDWWNNLPEEKRLEAERVAKKWNEQGVGNQEKQAA
jgi:hypothetical protein